MNTARPANGHPSGQPSGPLDLGGLPGPDSLPFVEALYQEYLKRPDSVPAPWRKEFDGWVGNGGPVARQVGPSFTPPGLFGSRTAGSPATADDLQNRADKLVRAYRVRGHLIARLDPLDRVRAHHPELELQFHGLAEEHLALPFFERSMFGSEPQLLSAILERLQRTYCRSIGVQFMHIDELDVRDWLQQRMESTQNRLALGVDEQRRILRKLSDAVLFEEFIQRKYLGAKRFSLEGAESLIPLLDLAVEKAGAQGLDEIVFGMAHRGRLNVLTNIIGKSPAQIFHEFEDKISPELGDGAVERGHGDVKYHLGYSGDVDTSSGHRVHLSLCFNPSHLEFVNPVALGRMRAKQDRFGDVRQEHGLVLLIHGDAAFAGQGVVQETLNLSQLDGYHVGGTLHVIVNNQIGFTTAPDEARSSHYATTVAKMLDSPIFHVNGEDPEAVAAVVDLAFDFRQKFRRDVVIDMYCYRRYGHNEGDEPAFSQPRMVAAIRRRQSVMHGYLEHLLELGGVSKAEAERIWVERTQRLEQQLSEARAPEYRPRRDAQGVGWEKVRGGTDAEVSDLDTGVARTRLSELLLAQTRLPEEFRPHPKIERFLVERAEMARGERPLNWGNAEALAFATLCCEGVRIRMSGQDTLRGTFSHRHAGLHDLENGRRHVPLQHLEKGQAHVEIINSPLSEIGVLGFEYGYSLDCPDGLVLWEAQFGDFFNVAQVIVDQFIASAEDKWGRLSGLVLLLPHGFEGMGPEHSSARLERFLTLAARDNMQIVQPTTPAQYFHLLRRQALRAWRKPLIVMTPKSLLRHPQCSSSLDDCACGRFQRVVCDRPVRAGARRVLLCSGKIYYELADERSAQGRDDVEIVRLEQLYPFPEAELERVLKPVPDGTKLVWVQEEPENMGAWRFLTVRCGARLWGRLPLSRVSRPACASPATGSYNSHLLEQRELILAAFGGL